MENLILLQIFQLWCNYSFRSCGVISVLALQNDCSCSDVEVTVLQLQCGYGKIDMTMQTSVRYHGMLLHLK